MYQLDPEALENRMSEKRKKPLKRYFVSCVADRVHRVDEDDIFMRYQNNILHVHHI